MGCFKKMDPNEITISLQPQPAHERNSFDLKERGIEFQIITATCLTQCIIENMSEIIWWKKAPKLSGTYPCTHFIKIISFSLKMFCIKLEVKVTVELLNKHKTRLPFQA